VYVYAHALTHTHQSSILIVCQKYSLHREAFLKCALARSLKYIYALARNQKNRSGAQPKMTNAWRADTLCPAAHFALLRAVAGLFTFFILLIAQEIHR
jgi:hypothetical protein